MRRRTAEEEVGLVVPRLGPRSRPEAEDTAVIVADMEDRLVVTAEAMAARLRPDLPEEIEEVMEPTDLPMEEDLPLDRLLEETDTEAEEDAKLDTVSFITALRSFLLSTTWTTF